MKSLLKPTNLPCTILGAGLIGMLLRIWLLASGTDSKGLLVSGHPADILSWLLTVAVILLLLYATRELQQAAKFSFNFPPSLPGAIGIGLGGVAIAITSVIELLDEPDALAAASSALGLLCLPVMCFLAHCRRKGRSANVLLRGLVCVYLMLHLVCYYRLWSSDPQIQDYAFQLLAIVCLMLACYHRAAFDGDMGNRRGYVFFNLACVYFCLISLPGCENMAFFLGVGCWMMTNLCSLLPLPRERKTGRFAKKHG